MKDGQASSLELPKTALLSSIKSSPQACNRSTCKYCCISHPSKTASGSSESLSLCEDDILRCKLQNSDNFDDIQTIILIVVFIGFVMPIGMRYLHKLFFKPVYKQRSLLDLIIKSLYWLGNKFGLCCCKKSRESRNGIIEKAGRKITAGEALAVAAIVAGNNPNLVVKNFNSSTLPNFSDKTDKNQKSNGDGQRRGRRRKSRRKSKLFELNNTEDNQNTENEAQDDSIIFNQLSECDDSFEEQRFVYQKEASWKNQTEGLQDELAALKMNFKNQYRQEQEENFTSPIISPENRLPLLSSKSSAMKPGGGLSSRDSPVRLGNPELFRRNHTKSLKNDL